MLYIYIYTDLHRGPKTVRLFGKPGRPKVVEEQPSSCSPHSNPSAADLRPVAVF